MVLRLGEVFFFIVIRFSDRVGGSSMRKFTFFARWGTTVVE